MRKFYVEESNDYLRKGKKVPKKVMEADLRILTTQGILQRSEKG